MDNSASSHEHRRAADTPSAKDRLQKLLLRRDVMLRNLNDNDFRIVLVSAASALPADTELTEKEVNERLQRWVETVGTSFTVDAIEMRRYLVDHCCLERDRAGRVYRRPAEWPSKCREAGTELAALDITSFAETVRREEAERRAERKKAALERNQPGSENH